MKTEIKIINSVNANPFWYFYNVYSGNHYQNQDSAFSDLIIFYQNLISNSVESFVCEKDFIRAFYKPNQERIKHIYFYWSTHKKENFILWNKRMVFLCNNQIEILAQLISIKLDNKTGLSEWNIYLSKAKSYVKLYEWLNQLPVKKEYEELKIQEWLQSIESTYIKSKAITESFEESVIVEKKVKRLDINEIVDSDSFSLVDYVTHNGQSTKEETVQLIKRVLVETGQTRKSQNPRKDKWDLVGYGKRANLIALLRVLYDFGLLSNKIHNLPGVTTLKIIRSEFDFVMHSEDSVEKALRSFTENDEISCKRKKYFENFFLEHKRPKI